MQNDDHVSDWLNGADSVDGRGNPAGPLYIEGAAATEDALTSPNEANMFSTRTAITCSGVACCICA